MNFIPQPFLIEALEGKNLRKVRVALSTYITKDLGYREEEILKAKNYISETYGNIWQEHDGEKEEVKENWNREYLGLLQADLMNNFSKERFNHILEVGRFIYGKKQNVSTTSGNNMANSNTSSVNSPPGIQRSPQSSTSYRGPSPTVYSTKGDKKGKYLGLAAVVVLAVSLLIYLIARD